MKLTKIMKHVVTKRLIVLGLLIFNLLVLLWGFGGAPAVRIVNHSAHLLSEVGVSDFPYEHWNNQIGEIEPGESTSGFIRGMKSESTMVLYFRTSKGPCAQNLDLYLQPGSGDYVTIEIDKDLNVTRNHHVYAFTWKRFWPL